MKITNLTVYHPANLEELHQVPDGGPVPIHIPFEFKGLAPYIRDDRSNASNIFVRRTEQTERGKNDGLIVYFFPDKTLRGKFDENGFLGPFGLRYAKRLIREKDREKDAETRLEYDFYDRFLYKNRM